MSKTPSSELGQFELSRHEKSKLHYGFLDENRKDLKEIFAVSYNGELYINIWEISKNIMRSNYSCYRKKRYWFFKAAPLGDFLQVYGVFIPDYSAIGAYYRAIGSLIVSAVSALSKATIPVVLDEQLKQFVCINNYSRLKKYLKRYHPSSTELLDKVKAESKKDFSQRENKNVFIRSILSKL